MADDIFEPKHMSVNIGKDRCPEIIGFSGSQTVIEEVISIIELDEKQLCAILREQFSSMGDSIEIIINCRQDFFDSVTIKSSKKTINHGSFKLK